MARRAKALRYSANRPGHSSHGFLCYSEGCEEGAKVVKAHDAVRVWSCASCGALVTKGEMVKDGRELCAPCGGWEVTCDTSASASRQEQIAATDVAWRALETARMHATTHAAWLVEAVDYLIACEAEQDLDERRVAVRVARDRLLRQLADTRARVEAANVADRALSDVLSGRPT